MSDFNERLVSFLKSRGESGLVSQLTPDASTREYFRIGWRGATAIACVYPESFSAAEQNYLDVTRLFRLCELPVAEVLDLDEAFGVIILEDLGDTILRDVLERSDKKARDNLINQAIDLIPRIQAATTTAFETGSISSKLRFDKEKLVWELGFFNTHYFQTLRRSPLDKTIEKAIELEFEELAEDLEDRASVLCHRDFHAANLMIAADGCLRIIDHQDARIGSVSYDLVSLLLDRVTQPPHEEWLAEKRRRFLSGREALGLGQIEEEAFVAEFHLQTIQRCLKAVGTFSFQASNRGKAHFLDYIVPMFRIVSDALQNIGRFPALREILLKEIDV
ncbi:MAG TPA: phosphotransferase [Pyrinomonadaceae bacterium]|nr:phosphotransferase [Pyrinomonadaceae bacterium]HMP64954.1 phosphotransferase [Pyrinomonadaceae bacterium]